MFKIPTFVGIEVWKPWGKLARQVSGASKTSYLPTKIQRFSSFGCFLKWWYPQNTTKSSFLVGKPIVVGYHHFRKHPFRSNKLVCQTGPRTPLQILFLILVTDLPPSIALGMEPGEPGILKLHLGRKDMWGEWRAVFFFSLPFNPKTTKCLPLEK